MFALLSSSCSFFSGVTSQQVGRTLASLPDTEFLVWMLKYPKILHSSYESYVLSLLIRHPQNQLQKSSPGLVGTCVWIFTVSLECNLSSLISANMSPQIVLEFIPSYQLGRDQGGATLKDVVFAW